MLLKKVLILAFTIKLFYSNTFKIINWLNNGPFSRQKNKQTGAGEDVLYEISYFETFLAQNKTSPGQRCSAISPRSGAARTIP